MKKENRRLDEKLIREVEEAYDHAWRKGDVAGIVTCFTKDAVVVTPRGDVAQGHQEIRHLFDAFLSSEAKNSKHTSRMIRISFLTNDVAVVDGEAFIEGGEFNNLSTLAHHRFTDILVRHGEVWRISQIRAYAKY